MALSFRRCALSLGILAGAASLFLAGCQMVASTTAATTSAPATATAPAAKSTFTLFGGKTTAEMGGAELWAQTCSRCHNLRSPSSFGPAQWEVAVYDMRVRANLTGEQQRKILEFLKAASQ